MKNHKLFVGLPDESKISLESIKGQLPFTFQEVRILITIETDLIMWEQPLIGELWGEFQKSIASKTITDVKRKKNLFFKLVNKTWNGHKSSLSYKTTKKKVEKREFSFKKIDSGDKIFGECPVASEKTICCNLKTVDPIQNCGFSCNYCCIQSFYPENSCYIEQDLKKKLKNIKLDQNKIYHFGTGQSSDSLMWGNKNGVLDDLSTFAMENSNLILEFKTKSKNINYFLDNIKEIPRNIICSWTLNTPTIIREEEIGTATLDERLNAAKKLTKAGLLVAFHFHPIIYYEGWEKEYGVLFDRVVNEFNPKEIAFISFGTLTYTKPTIKKIRLSKSRSKVLQMHLEDTAGKLSYPKDIKERLFRFAYNKFKSFQSKTFFYLCMEERHYWETTFDCCYKDNVEFETGLAMSVMAKVRKLK